MKTLGKQNWLYIGIALFAMILGGLTALNWVKPKQNTYFDTRFDSNIKAEKLADFNQDYLIIDFWASWCAPCVKSLPYYEALFNALPQDQFAYVAVNLDSDVSSAKQFLAELGLDKTPVFYDPKGQLQQAMNINGLPTLLILNKQQEVARLQGFNQAHQTKLENLLARLQQN